MTRPSFWTAALLLAVALTTASLAAARAAGDTPPGETAASRFAPAGEEVRDTQTGLTWMRCSVGQSWSPTAGCVGVVRLLTWDQAMALQGSGYRVPTIKEYEALVRGSGGQLSGLFPGMNPRQTLYWTSSRVLLVSAWAFDFDRGVRQGRGVDERFAVRLVRAGP